jgi:hypothetical protein
LVPAKRATGFEGKGGWLILAGIVDGFRHGDGGGRKIVYGLKVHLGVEDYERCEMMSERVVMKLKLTCRRTKLF